MADENKPTVPEPPKPPAGEKPAANPAGVKPPVAPPPTSTAPPKPAAPPPPAKPAGPAPIPWDSEIAQSFRKRYGSGVKEASTYLGQNYLIVEPSLAYETLEILRDDWQFDYCVDVTAVHYPQRKAQEFDLVWILYSFPRNERLRVKAMFAEGEKVPSVTGLWETANWLERECFDMFGTVFEGHPGLKRILLPDEWKGHPLRKDYGILQQDTEWVQINLGIESGQ